MGFPQSNHGQSWNKLSINNEVYMMCATQKDDAIEILLTNFIDIWMERFTEEIIIDRCRDLNPLLPGKGLNFKEIILNILNDVSKHITEASPEEIKLRVKIEGNFMKFALNLTKGTPQDFWELITKPLCVSTMEIIRQHEFLLNLVKKKDEEIAEYKAEGAELIRKNIETEPFTEEQLRINTSDTNIDDYTNIFQAITKLYNAVHTQEDNESSVKSTSNDQFKEEQNTDTLSQDGAGVSEDGCSTTIKAAASPSKGKKLKKNRATDEGSSNKVRNASMPHIPVKKLKKNLLRSIL